MMWKIVHLITFDESNSNVFYSNDHQKTKSINKGLKKHRQKSTNYIKKKRKKLLNKKKRQQEEPKNDVNFK